MSRLEEIGKNTRFSSGERAAEMGRKGGREAQRRRQEAVNMRRLLEANLDQLTPDGRTTYAQRITASLLNIASNPKYGAASVRAYEKILHVLGQDEPEQKQDTIELLAQILEVNRKNAERIQSERETADIPDER